MSSHHGQQPRFDRQQGTRRRATRKHAPEILAANLEALRELSKAALRERWEGLYGSPCPAHISRQLLTRALAHRMQEQVLGGLDRATRRRLERAANDLAAGRALVSPVARVKPGTRLLREWQGIAHEVIVLEKSVHYQGKNWPSLSAVAREITGARWSGPRFFGLKRKARGRG